MKCLLNTNNQNFIQNRKSFSFKAKPIKVDWNSHSGKLIEMSLAGLASTLAANVKMIMEHHDSEYYALLKEYEEYNTESWADEKFNLVDMKRGLETAYKKTKDPNIMDKHLQILPFAIKNKTRLNGGLPYLLDQQIYSTMLTGTVVEILDLIGIKNMKAALNLDIDSYMEFCGDVSYCLSKISRANIELLKKKINPQSTNEYKNLEEDVKNCKKRMNTLLGKDKVAERNSLLSHISNLKKNKSNSAEIKNLQNQIRNLYKTSENYPQLQELMHQISEKQKMMKDIISQKVDISSQEIIDKLWTIAKISFSNIYYTEISSTFCEEILSDEQKMYLDSLPKEKRDTVLAKICETLLGEDFKGGFVTNKRMLNRDIKNLINLIQPSSQENEQNWKNYVNRKIYDFANLKYNKKYVTAFDFANCKYLNKLLSCNDDFWDLMSPFMTAIAVYLYSVENSTISDALNYFEHNCLTKEMFNEFGINYDKWTKFDNNSYIQKQITISAKDAREKVVKDMCAELTSRNMKSNIPQAERNSLYQTLSSVGVEIDENGVLINGEKVEFSDLDIIMSAIKNELNTNSFWSRECKDATCDDVRSDIYYHLMIQIKQQIDAAKKLEENETIDIKVQKVDMSDIKHSLFLGNDSHCCTAIGSHTNEWSAISYIMNRSIGAIEIIANGEAIGNTMIYPATVNGELSLILDDIELQTKYINNEQIRDMIIEYSKQICKDIGRPNIPIYAVAGVQKSDFSSYPLLENAEMVILGKSASGYDVYLNYDRSAHDIGNIIETLDLYKIF